VTAPTRIITHKHAHASEPLASTGCWVTRAPGPLAGDTALATALATAGHGQYGHYAVSWSKHAARAPNNKQPGLHHRSTSQIKHKAQISHRNPLQRAWPKPAVLARRNRRGSVKPAWSPSSPSQHHRPQEPPIRQSPRCHWQ
jgi:hypothetical protein